MCTVMYYGNIIRKAISIKEGRILMSKNSPSAMHIVYSKAERIAFGKTHPRSTKKENKYYVK